MLNSTVINIHAYDVNDSLGHNKDQVLTLNFLFKNAMQVLQLFWIWKVFPFAD